MKKIVLWALVLLVCMMLGSAFAGVKYRWYIVKGKDGVCRVIQADEKTPATIAGPFKTRTSAEEAKAEACSGKWFIIKGKDGVCKIIQAADKTAATIAGPFKTRENAEKAKAEACLGKWFVIKGKDGVCKVIVAAGKTAATIAGPFKTKENAVQAKTRLCGGEAKPSKKKAKGKKAKSGRSELEKMLLKLVDEFFKQKK